MKRSSPRQTFWTAFLLAFLLSCAVFWLSSFLFPALFQGLENLNYALTLDGDASVLPLVLFFSLLLSFTAAFVAWVCSSLSQLRLENAALRAELERIKNKE